MAMTAALSLGVVAPVRAQPLPESPPPVSSPLPAEPAAPASPLGLTPPPPPPSIGAAVAADGRVIDAMTGEPIAGAIVSVDGSDRMVASGADGSFSLGQVAPSSSLVAVADGYELGLAVVVAGWAGEIALLPEGTSSEVIEITGEAPRAVPGATILARDEVSRLPGTGNDLIASLDVLPGVTSPLAAAGFNGVVIRGSAPEDSKILIDGFEVPLLYHIGLRSILPSESIASLEYLPGGFDVAYGQATSGIVAVSTRGGQRDLGGQAEVSVIDSGVLAHGPAGDGTFLVAVRRSTIDLFLPAVIPDDAEFSLVTVPRYYDMQARYDVNLGSRWKLALSAIGTDDAVEAFADDEPDPDERFSFRTRFLRLIGDARWHRDHWSANIAGSMLAEGVGFEIGRDLFLQSDRLAGTLRGEVAWSKSAVRGLRDVTVRAGGSLDQTRYDLALALPRPPGEGEPDADNGSIPGGNDIEEMFDGTIDVSNLAAWTSAAAGLGPVFRLTAGVRVDGYTRSGDVAVQPRGELAAKLGPDTTARLVAGAYRRPAEYQDELLDDTLQPEESTHLILGAERSLGAGIKVQASAYLNERRKLLTRTPEGGYANQGQGRSMGVELLSTLRRGPWFGFLSYTLSHSTRVDRMGEAERLFDYDQPHDLNVALSWQRGPWQLGARFSYASGLPYTPVLRAIYDSDADAYTPLYGDINSERVPGHHQLDIRIDRTWQVGPIALSAFLDVQNVYMNSTVIQYQYSFDYSERTAFESIPILPSIGLRGVL